METAALHADGGGEQSAEWPADAVHRDLGFGNVRGRAGAASSEEQRGRPKESGADYRLSGTKYAGPRHRREATGGEDLWRTAPVARRGGLHRRVERPCRPARAAGVDAAGGAYAEAGLSGAWRAGCAAGPEGRDREDVQAERRLPPTRRTLCGGIATLSVMQRAAVRA